MVQQFPSCVPRIRSKQFPFIWSEKVFLPFKLHTEQPQEKSCLPNWFTICHLLIEEMPSLTVFATECRSSLSNISSKLSTISDYFKRFILSSSMKNVLLLFLLCKHSKIILENTVEIKSQPVALDFKNLSQYSSRSK